MATTMIKLQSSDEVVVEVPENVAKMSTVIANQLADDPTNSNLIMIPLATGETLRKMFEFCGYHAEHPEIDLDLAFKENKYTDAYDVAFLTMDLESAKRIILAANYLDIKILLNICTIYFANVIRGKSVGTIREIFKIPAKAPQAKTDENMAPQANTDADMAPQANADENMAPQANADENMAPQANTD